MKNYKYVLISSIVFVCLLFAMTSKGYAVNSEIAQTLGDEVNIRIEPDQTSRSLLKLSAGSEVEILSSSNGWYQVECQGVQGYIREDLVFVRNVEGRTAYVIRDGVNLRGSPGDGAYIIGHIQGGEAVRVLQIVGEWFYVSHQSQGNGFVHRSLLLLTNQSGKDSYDLLLKRDMEGSEVKRLQKELIRRNFLAEDKDTGVYGSLTISAVKEFQQAAKISSVDGVAGPETIKAIYDTNNNIIKKIQEADSEMSGSSGGSSGKSLYDRLKGNVSTIDWWKGGNVVLRRPGGTATIYDVSTGKTFRIRRTGGTNHNDVVPLNAQETAKMRAITGGWSWARRAIVVMTSNGNYAASMNCMPHSPDPQKNDNFPGHFCIHFTNSRTHGGNRVDPDHRAAIQRAYNTFK